MGYSTAAGGTSGPPTYRGPTEEGLVQARLMWCGRIVSATLALALLAGCSGDNVLGDLGLRAAPPNAFLVTTEAPLAMPPSLTNLPPPTPGAPRPQAVSPRLTAEEALVPAVALAGTDTGGPISPGQEALIAKSGPPAPADLRSELVTEAKKDRPSEGPLAWLLFWKPAPLPGVVLDPLGERRRLQQNAALGRPPTYGKTPVIHPKNDSLF